MNRLSRAHIHMLARCFAALLCTPFSPLGVAQSTLGTPPSTVASTGVPAVSSAVVERGPVRATVSVEPSAVTIGDTVVLQLQVVAQPEVEVTLPSFGQALGRFSILDFVPSERIDDDGQTHLRQRYTLYASSSGEHTVPSLIVEFVDRRAGKRPAPDGEDAYELLTKPVVFTVDSVVPENASDALRPLYGPLEARVESTPSRWPWWLALVATVLIVGAGLWRWRARSPARSNAYDLALARLGALRGTPRPALGETQAMDAFFVELSSIVRRYLEDRFSLQAPELTTEEFLDIAVSSPDLTQNHQRFLTEFLRTADQVKFAHQLPESEYLDTALSAVASFLDQTREGTDGD
ncbi:MAG: hypothetical protein ACI8PT_000433 [Gammaproteobacteria bacterium]|jgi:hypothetical protein